SGEKRVFLVILFTSFSGSLVSRIPGAVQLCVMQVSIENNSFRGHLLYKIKNYRKYSICDVL
ncbi:hypothetical protein PSY75_12975, partial [Shigella flexneri]|nr:hypothetical protein [Shigella flexneri]MDD0199707.1 hypothetical protein [Shigella flexneri]MDD0686476.1 hypothetical protein [Shigella sonnei]